MTWAGWWWRGMSAVMAMVGSYTGTGGRTEPPKFGGSARGEGDKAKSAGTGFNKLTTTPLLGLKLPLLPCRLRLRLWILLDNHTSYDCASGNDSLLTCRPACPPPR